MHSYGLGRLHNVEVCQKIVCLHSHVLGLLMPVICAPAESRLAFSDVDFALLYQFKRSVVLCLSAVSILACLCVMPLVTTSGVMLCRSSYHCQTPAHSVGH